MKQNPRKKRLPSQRRRPILWTADKYVAVVKGGDEFGIPGGLRSYFRGFETDDGFDLRNVKSWSKSQREKVRERYHRYKLINGQPKRFVRIRNEENLRKVQESFHDEIPSSDMKGAFVPDTEPMVSAGFKKKPMRVRVLKEGISIMRPGLYDRQFVPFSQKQLARNARKEIARASSMMKNVSLYFVQVGEFQSLNGMSLGIVTKQVLDWMSQYDGRKPLPSSSGNKGDSPKHHHWKHWLKGLVGYTVPKSHTVMDIARRIVRGRRANDELKRLRGNLERRGKAKPRKRKSKGKKFKL